MTFVPSFRPPQEDGADKSPVEPAWQSESGSPAGAAFALNPRELMDVEAAHGMLAWPHSGFHVHDGVWVAADDHEFAVRLARYCARKPVALSRLEYR